MEAFGPEVVAFVQSNPKLTIIFTLALCVWRMLPYVERAISRFATFYSVVLDGVETMAKRTVVFIKRMRRLWKDACAEPKEVAPKSQGIGPGPVAVPDIGKGAA
jgi:hypothetical protein